MSQGDHKLKVWNSILKTSLSLPGARIDRSAFLKSQLSPHFSPDIVAKAIEGRPAAAGIPMDKIDDIAASCIGWHTVQVSTISFVTGLPGGWWIAGTIPADLAQFYWHSIVTCQKLAYLYGWPELIDDDQGATTDDETLMRMTLLIGVMMGAQGAARIVTEFAERFAMEVARRLPREALTKYGLYNFVKQIAKWISIQVTKNSFAKGLSRVIPIVGGIVSAAVSAATFIPMANRLKDHLKTLRFAQPNGPNLEP